MATTVRIPYSTTSLEFDIPSNVRVDHVLSCAVAPVTDAHKAIREALAHPAGSPELPALAKAGDKVCIVFTDITRSSPDHLLVPALLEEVEKAGVKDGDITLLCGIGMHRASTGDEKLSKLGEKVVARYRVIDSEPQNSAALVDMGLTQEESLSFSIGQWSRRTYSWQQALLNRTSMPDIQGEERLWR